MARTKLGMHWIPRHIDNDDYVVAERWNPTVIKIVDPDPNFVHEIINRTDSIIVLRDHPLSEQHTDMVERPAETGTYHAGVWGKYVDANDLRRFVDRILVEGINEPHVWNQGVDEALNVYTVSFLDGLKRLGLRGVALNFSVGWPRNDGPDLPPRWDLYEPSLEAIERGNHVLGIHEYWPHFGVDYSWGWLAGRYTQCPWDVPIFIGECGMEEAVIGETNFDKRGWKAWLTKDEYMAQLAEYDRRIAEDSRIFGAVIFTYDYSGPEWKSVDVRDGLRWKLVDYAKSAVLPDPPPMEKPIDSGVVTVAALNVRPSPNLDNRPVDVLHKGDKVDIFEEATGDGYEWYRIGRSRWVAAKYIDTGDSDVDDVTEFDGGVVWPLPGKTTVTQRFLDNPSWYKRNYGVDGHNGIDIVAAKNSRVLSIADGVVKWVGRDPGGYGLYVRIWHPGVDYRGGTVYSFYAHLDSSFVKRGDKVTKGQPIGIMGSTGRSTGPHLHLEIRVADENGEYRKVHPDLGRGRIDPEVFFSELGLFGPTGKIAFVV